MIDTKVTKTERPMKKVAVRKAGPVRLTAAANAAYIPWDCLIA
ncbi:hypothetical protein [Micromonospora sp. NBS 11-29]|nr:hypothetical protein [Micromonospora sp. NBS 11-29]